MFVHVNFYFKGFFDNVFPFYCRRVGDHGNGAKNNQGGAVDRRGSRQIVVGKDKDSPVTNIS